ncbi:hypothetical protein I545_6917 [Mycobacterium kansasii 662]|uniref:Uncharacterized protein n=1 Tax=Mycobacterium kansasii 662 TaxID=1299326 RepID=X7XP02_MYCKA|nr:hypothetical protein I545_6917 [Mycobacterium kansasii 662]
MSEHTSADVVDSAEFELGVGVVRLDHRAAPIGPPTLG